MILGVPKTTTTRHFPLFANKFIKLELQDAKVIQQHIVDKHRCDLHPFLSVNATLAIRTPPSIDTAKPYNSNTLGLFTEQI